MIQKEDFTKAKKRLKSTKEDYYGPQYSNHGKVDIVAALVLTQK